MRIPVFLFRCYAALRKNTSKSAAVKPLFTVCSVSAAPALGFQAALVVVAISLEPETR